MPVTLQHSADRRIATITIGRPAQHNSLNQAALAALAEATDALAGDSQCRAVIITGSGSKTFCAGAALDQLSSGELTSEQYADAMERVAAIAQPTIALLNGNAYGGGAELALCCDFRLASAPFAVRIPPAALGLCYPPRGLARYLARLGQSASRQLFLSALPHGADTLLRIGYLTELVPAERLADRATELADQLATLSPQAVNTMKQIFNDFEQPSDALLERAQQLADACNQAGDLAEGLAAVAAKRPAQFADR